jgi:O-6-methylguanine DNA methyltransferase
MGVVQGENGIKKIILPHPFRQDVKEIIVQQFPNAQQNDIALEYLTKTFNAYFKGKKISQNLPIDWSGNSEFSKKVLTATQSIPWGEVRTYKWLSLHLKKPHSFRAIGNALRRNPFPIVVPCHRVICSDGSLGGFSAPSGVFLKRKLLVMEGICFDKNGRVVENKKSIP